MTAPRPTVGVDELQRAWRAVRAGHFHTPSQEELPNASTDPLAAHVSGLDGPPPSGGLGPRSHPGVAWLPAAGDHVVPVIGCHGGAGASTLALAMASTAGPQTRVVECVGSTASSLPGASTAELGLDASGWWARGRRGNVLIERAALPHAAVTSVPVPSVPPWLDGVTVLDVGWELGQVLGADSWVTDHVRTAPTVVLVARATVPGLRRLEGALAMLSDAWAPTGRDGDRDVTVAVLGPRRSRWPACVRHSISTRAQDVITAGRWVDVPEDRSLTRRGLDSTPLSVALLRSAAAVHEHLTPPRARCASGDEQHQPTPTPHLSDDLMDYFLEGQQL